MIQDPRDRGAQEPPNAETCLAAIRDTAARMGRMEPGSRTFAAELTRLEGWMIGLRAAPVTAYQG